MRLGGILNMLEKFLKDVVSLVVGKSADQIVDLLNTKKYVNEFVIAKKLDLTINQTRNILYKLSDHGLVSSIRKKDKKKGWYTYFWKIEVVKSLEFLKEIRLKQMTNFNNQIQNRETKQFYICERCNIEFNEETALLHDFTCNECGEIFTARDNTKVLTGLKKSSSKIAEEIKLIETELSNENVKTEKEKEKRIEEEKKTAKKIRAKKMAAKKRLNKPVSKKVVSGKQNLKLKQKFLKNQNLKKKPAKKNIKRKSKKSKKVISNKKKLKK